jgi:uncharacterized membrane protein
LLYEGEETARTGGFRSESARNTVVMGTNQESTALQLSTIRFALKRSSWLRAKYLLFAAIGIMLAYVIPHDESFLVHPKDPLWRHYEPFKWWLLPHGLAGACALLLGPMQFSERLRERFRQLHRVVGRIYISGVFVAAPLGFYIQYFQQRMGVPRSFSIAAAADAALWMTTTGIAMIFILKGKVQQHRQWMTRSFAVALVFLEVRVIGGVTGWESLGAHANETIVWACLLMSLPVNAATQISRFIGIWQILGEWSAIRKLWPRRGSGALHLLRVVRPREREVEDTLCRLRATFNFFPFHFEHQRAIAASHTPP